MEQNTNIPLPPPQDEKYRRAQERVRKMKSFYHNLITFVLVNILLLIINLVFSPHSLWFLWVTIIWGIVLLVQAFNTFTIRDSFLGDAWEERKIRELMEKDKNKKSGPPPPTV